MSKEGKLTASVEQSKVNATTEGMADIKDNASVKSSRHSGSSRLSHRSGSSALAAAAKARAQAEAARTRAQFIQKEMAIKLDQIKLEMSHQLERGKLEANLQIMQHEKEAAAALAEAEILEAAAEDEVSRKSGYAPSSQHKMERTRDYVTEQVHFTVRSEAGSEGSYKGESLRQDPSRSAHHSAHGEPLTHTDPTFQENISSQSKLTEQNTFNAHLYDSIYADGTRPSSYTAADHQPKPSPNSSLLYHTQLSTHSGVDLKPPADSQPHPGSYLTPHYNPQPSSYSSPHNNPRPSSYSMPNNQPQPSSYSAPYHQPRQGSHSTPHLKSEGQDMFDFARFLARRELVNTGLTKFDDQPETFRPWKSAFHNAIQGLGITPSEELDLLTKWLGRESSEHVRRIRSVHLGDPVAALKMAWTRLAQCYGTPEMMENVLFKKLETFSKIGNREYTKLRELGDLLMEVQAAKDNSYLPGLSYFDTPRGINPIVEKLPYYLQERWISHGMRYKEENYDCFPPFWYFTGFVCQEAKARNDPSFNFLSSNPTKGDRFIPNNQRMPIAVNKTDVSPSDIETSPEDNDPGKCCPIHNKPHPLRKCRGFRMKTLEERKAYLKVNGICFKCCASSSHLARNCRAAVKCTECDSENHCTALHPGPPPAAFQSSSPSTGDGGEEETSSSSVTSACTKVCGKGLTTKSCSKICLVQVYPHGEREKSVKMYAMLDDQSNRSLAKSEFFEHFHIDSYASPYSLKTCAGITNTTGRRADGFTIEPVHGGVSLPLPTLIECNEIPDNRSEIPTPEVAFHHPHLKPIAPEIPELNEKAQILLLLGRDILRVHKVRKQVNGPHNAPFALKLDLGWVLVGDVCLGSSHLPKVQCFKPSVLENTGSATQNRKRKGKKIPSRRKRKKTLKATEPTNHPCTRCTGVFPSAERLSEHQRKAHRECKTCGEFFPGVIKLREHEIKAHGVLPHKCDYCDKSFTYKGHYDVHVKSRHTGEKTCHCDVCGKGYCSVTSLKTHKLTHANKTFTCDVCGKSFYHLVRHKLVHEDVKPYQCEFCGRGFTQAENMMKHRAVHTDGKQLCSLCGKSYTTRDGLRYHMISKHSHELPPQEGDLVLMKDAQAARNEWPMALVSDVLKSPDGITQDLPQTNHRGHSSTIKKG